MAPIRIALLGSGIFARDAHLPALKTLTDQFEIVAIYGRRPDNATALAETIDYPVTVSTDLDELLARPDIDAVDIMLPIPVQPEVVEAALRAGKHVISEKPIAPDVSTGRALIEAAKPLIAATKKVWMVAENFRFEEAYQAAGEAIQHGEIGQPLQFTWSSSGVLNQQNKYYLTSWRRENGFPGGFLLDGGVHNVAAMRMIMGEIESVSAYVSQVRIDLPPADTLSATIRFDSGAFGTLTMTFAAGDGWSSEINVIGDKGRMRVNPKELEILRPDKETNLTFAVNNVTAELADFARAIQDGGSFIDTPEQALQDVAVIEAMLKSAETGTLVKPERIIQPD